MKVKICCISSIAEALQALQAGASAIGLVGPMPSGPGVLPMPEIASIVSSIPAAINTFLLTSETSAEKIVHQHQLVKTSTIQLVDELEQDQLRELKKELPAVDLVQVIHVLDDESLDHALQKAELVDYLLLDSGNPNLQIKELGGTGRIHDWGISRQIVEQSPVPVFLAGGLNSENVAQAIAAVQPYGLDLCSGVRTDRKLDSEKLKRFFAATKIV